MSNRDHSAIFELVFDHILNEIVCLLIYVR
jgi:hypothetical protein